MVNVVQVAGLEQNLGFWKVIQTTESVNCNVNSYVNFNVNCIVK